MKKHKIIIEEEEVFVIPQISFNMDQILRKKSKFQKSEIVSPVHGSNVLDKMHYVDNSGKVNIDYGYDYIRDQKHISDEEMIRRHGTKYYEFTFLNDQLTDEEKKGSDYSKKQKEEAVAVEEQTDTLNSFFETPQEMSVEPALPQKEEVSEENKEFKIHLSLEDEDTYEYNTFSDKFPKPEQQTVSSYYHPDFPERTDSFEPISAEPAPKEEPQLKEEIVYSQEERPVEHPAEAVSSEKPVSKKYENYSIPYERLFEKSSEAEEELPAWLEEKKEVINQALKAFGIDGEVITYTKGPAFTRYEIMLAENVNVKKVNSIYDTLQMRLQAISIRIQAPIPGKNTVGIEVPNDKADVVKFGDILTDDFIRSKKNLVLAMGKMIDGTPFFQTIVDMPHALIAGATKSGKSVSINTILVSLLIKNSPEQLKLILVDPKKVELSFYNNLPHLATPVIDDPLIATEALKWAVEEMERRYQLLAESYVRNIEDYNRRRAMRPEMENLPFIVIVVDEFNDLVMQCGQEANDAIIRLAQKARAAGIHLILATQRPTVNVVNGTIKSNITCRIAFKVASDADSRIILDEQGAESLLGRGDMLIKNNGLPERVQGAYISDDEIVSICEYICSQYEPDFLFTHEDLKKKANKNAGGVMGNKEVFQEPEELLYQVAMFCIESGTCSINSIQNNFALGFNRASRIVSILEERNIVGPRNGGKSRELLVDTYQLKQMFEDKL